MVSRTSTSDSSPGTGKQLVFDALSKSGSYKLLWNDRLALNDQVEQFVQDNESILARSVDVKIYGQWSKSEVERIANEALEVINEMESVVDELKKELDQQSAE